MVFCPIKQPGTYLYISLAEVPNGQFPIEKHEEECTNKEHIKQEYSGFRVDGTNPKMSFRWGSI